ncbi:MAG: helix-turn-helix transcriptional regulator [Candidatus Schekmanbacteria bacterium]|nr:helix-turn-helix transcriptional regulator [Candidatus Schekmanbacteria bacterium]
MDDLREKICAKIFGLRKALNLTQSGFAEKVGLSEEYIRKMELRKSTPSLESLFKIADALNLSIYDLIDFDQPKPERDEALNSVITLLQTRSPEDIKLLHEVGLKIFEGLDRHEK